MKNKVCFFNKKQRSGGIKGKKQLFTGTLIPGAIDYHRRICHESGDIQDNKVVNGTKKVIFPNLGLARTDRGEHLFFDHTNPRDKICKDTERDRPVSDDDNPVEVRKPFSTDFEEFAKVNKRDDLPLIAQMPVIYFGVPGTGVISPVRTTSRI